MLHALFIPVMTRGISDPTSHLNPCVSVLEQPSSFGIIRNVLFNKGFKREKVLDYTLVVLVVLKWAEGFLMPYGCGLSPGHLSDGVVTLTLTPSDQPTDHCPSSL